MEWLLLVFAYWLGMYLFLVYGLPLIGAVFGFAAMTAGIALQALGEACVLVMAGAFRLLGRGCVITGRGIGLAGTFLFFLIQEWLRGDPAEDEAAREDEAAEDEFGPEQAALLVLGIGIKRDFTRADLDAAYKRTIRKVHPDAGGSTEMAQAVNAARDLLMRSKGWA